GSTRGHSCRLQRSLRLGWCAGKNPNDEDAGNTAQTAGTHGDAPRKSLEGKSVYLMLDPLRKRQKPCPACSFQNAEQGSRSQPNSGTKNLRLWFCCCGRGRRR